MKLKTLNPASKNLVKIAWYFVFGTWYLSTAEFTLWVPGFVVVSLSGVQLQRVWDVR